MNQAETVKLVSRLRIPILPKHRRLRNPEGPQGRVKKIRAIVTALFKYERIEMNHYHADEARGEKLYFCSHFSDTYLFFTINQFFSFLFLL